MTLTAEKIYNPPSIGGLAMNGVIRTRSKCHDCGTAFEEGYRHGRVDLYCSCGQRPRTYYLYVYAGGNRIITKDNGKKLESYDQALRLLTTIRKRIDDKIFDVHDYLPKSLRQYTPHKLILRWYRSKLKKGLAPTTLKEIKSHIRNYIAPIGVKIGATDCREIRTHHIDAFFDRLPARLSQKTKDNIMTNLQSFINWLRRKEILERNPEFPLINVPKAPVRWAKKDYLLQALPHVPGHDRPVIHFMLYHPLRSGEVAALKVKDFMFDEGIVHVCRAFSMKVLRSRKNKRPYYLALSEHFDRSILKNKFPESFAFINSIGNPYSSNHLKKIWRTACEKSGIEYIPLKNAGRTSIASAAVNRGESLYPVAAALGNTPGVVESNYGHLRKDATKRVVDGK